MAHGDIKKREALRKLLKRAPKPQLHLHLDGSISFDFIKRSMKRMKRDQPDRFAKLFPAKLEAMTREECMDWIWTVKEQSRLGGDVANEGDNWCLFNFCNQFLQTEEDLRDATIDLVTRFNENHAVDYIEIRFAPCLQLQCGLTEEAVVQIVIDAFNEAKSTIFAEKSVEINGGVILCALRSFSVEESRSVKNLVASSDALGFDIAGDEGSYPLARFKDVLHDVKKENIRSTIHAGEWCPKTFPSVFDNLRLCTDVGVDRIGHGLAVEHVESDVIDTLREKRVGIEVCVTGNCGNVDRCAGLGKHPLPMMLNNGLQVTGLNCDDTLVEGSRELGQPDPTTECVRALLDVKISVHQLLQVIENGYRYGFHANAHAQADRVIEVWREEYIPKIIDILNE